MFGAVGGFSPSAFADPPNANDDWFNAGEDVGAIWVGNVLWNDSDNEFDPLTVQPQTNVPGDNGGLFTIAANGDVTFNPNGAFNSVPNGGTRTTAVMYTVSDGSSTSTAWVRVDVSGENDTPTAVNDVFTYDPNGSPQSFSPGVLDNDTDPDQWDNVSFNWFRVTGDPTQYNAFDTATISGVGTITIRWDGSVEFTPDVGFSGLVPLITYEVRDNQNATAQATLRLIPRQGRPDADDEVNSTNEDTVLTVTTGADNLLDGDIDPESATLTITSFTLAGNPTVFAAGATATVAGLGTLRITSTGGYTLTPIANAFGTLPVVTYTVTDPLLATDTGTLSLTINAVPDVPVADDETASALINTTITAAATPNGLLVGDTDGDGNTLTVESFTVPSDLTDHPAGPTGVPVTTAGTITIDTDGSYTFVPTTGYTGTLVITYTVADGTGQTDTGTLTITIIPIPTAPSGTDKTIIAYEDEPVTLRLSDFGFTDVDSNAFASVLVTTLPAAGTLRRFNTAVAVGTTLPVADFIAGRITWTAAANASGVGYASFTFQVADNGVVNPLDLSPNTITFDVRAVNDSPVGTDKMVTTNLNTPYIITAADFGFSDTEPNTFTGVLIKALPLAGTLTNNAVAVNAGDVISIGDINSGLLRWTPPTGATGTLAALSFQVQDSGANDPDGDGGAGSTVMNAVDGAFNWGAVTVVTPGQRHTQAFGTITLTYQNTGGTSIVKDGGYPSTGSNLLAESTIVEHVRGNPGSVQDMTFSAPVYTQFVVSDIDGTDVTSVTVYDDTGAIVTNLADYIVTSARGSTGVYPTPIPTKFRDLGTNVNVASAGSTVTLTPTSTAAALTYARANAAVFDFGQRRISRVVVANLAGGADAWFLAVSPTADIDADSYTRTPINTDQTARTMIFAVSLDTDGDGVADISDIDDDNDGILDTVERTSGAAATTRIYIPGSNNRLYRIDNVNGTPTRTDLGNMGVYMSAIGMAPDGTLYGINPSSRQFYRINTTTAAVTPVGTLPATVDWPNALTFTPDGTGYVGGDWEWRGFTMSPSTPGTVTPWHDFGFWRGSGGDFVFVNNRFYASWRGVDDYFHLIEGFVDPNRSVMTTRVLGLLPAATWGLAGDAQGNLYGASGMLAGNNGALYRINIPTAPVGGGSGVVSYTIVNTSTFSYEDATSNSESQIAGTTDTDGDGYTDDVDIDSDNDGITDNVEAQRTATYIVPTGLDSDGDGLDNAYDAASGPALSNGLTPVDTDSDGTADWRDANSDGDSANDIAERGDGQSTTVTSTADTDRDGLLDIFEAGSINDGFDVNDSNRTAALINLAGGGGLLADGSNAVPLTLDSLFRCTCTVAQVTVVKAGPATAAPSSSFSYTLDLGNSTSAASPTTVNIAEALPAGVTVTAVGFTADISAVSCTGTTGSFTCAVTVPLGIPAGATSSDTNHRITLTVTAPSAGGSITNYASVAADGSGTPPTPGAGCAPAPGCSSATTNIAVPATPPAGTDKTITMYEDMTYTLREADFGYSDANGDAFASVVIDTLPAAGTLRRLGTAVTAGQVITIADIRAGRLSFEPVAQASGDPYANFTFSVRSAGGGSDTDLTPNTIAFKVVTVVERPAGADKSITLAWNQSYPVVRADFGFTDSDPNNFTGVWISSLPSTGSLTLNGTPVVVGDFITIADIDLDRLVYTPPANTTGVPIANFTFQVQDDGNPDPDGDGNYLTDILRADAGDFASGITTLVSGSHYRQTFGPVTVDYTKTGAGSLAVWTESTATAGELYAAGTPNQYIEPGLGANLVAQFSSPVYARFSIADIDQSGESDRITVYDEFGVVIPDPWNYIVNSIDATSGTFASPTSTTYHGLGSNLAVTTAAGTVTAATSVVGSVNTYTRSNLVMFDFGQKRISRVEVLNNGSGGTPGLIWDAVATTADIDVDSLSRTPLNRDASPNRITFNIPAVPNVTIAKSGPASVSPSASYSYSFDLGNSGSAASPTTINVTDQLPAGVVLDSVTAGAGVTSLSCGTLPSAAGAAVNCTVTLPSGIPIGGTTSDSNHIFTFNVTAPSTGGSITNFVAVSPSGNGAVPTPGAGCTPASSCSSATTSVQAVNLTVAKSGPGSALVGSTLTYTLDLGNSGVTPSPLTVNVAEQLPAGMVATAVTAGSGVSSVGCGTLPSAAGALLSCAVTVPTAIAAGETTADGSRVITITVTAPSSTGSITNYASVAPDGSGTPPTPGAGCTPVASCGSATTSITAPNVTLAKSGPATALAGSSFSYSFDLGNSGTAVSPLTVNVAEQLPAGVVATAVNAGSGVSSVSCGTLPSAAGAALSCVVTLSTAVAIGESTSDGAHAFTITATAPSSTGSITNYASIATDGSGTPPTPGAGCVTTSCASSSTTVIAPNVTIAKTAPATASISTSLTYAFDLGNTGSAASPLTINVTETLPTGVVATAVTAGSSVTSVNCGTLPSAAGATLNCVLTLATAVPTTGTTSDGAHTFTITATAPVAAATITNYASVAPDGTGTPPTPGVACASASCASATTDVRDINVTIAKSGPAAAVVGTSLSYSFDLGNAGATASPLTINLAEQLPPGVVATAVSAGSGVTSVNCGTLPSASGAALSCVLTLSTAVAGGESTSDGAHVFTITVTAPSTTGSITNYVAVSTSGDGSAPTPGAGCTPASSCGSATTSITAPNVTLAKTGPVTALVGSSYAYSFDLGNAGTAVSPLTVNVSEDLPAGVVATAVTAGSGVSSVDCGTLPSAAGAVLSCSVTLSTAVAIGESTSDGAHVFTITATAPSSTGSITNYASVAPDGSGTPPSPGAGCSTTSCASSSTTITAPNVTLAKTGPATALVGSSYSYSFDVGNSGTAVSPLTVNVSEDLPAGVVATAVTAGSGVSSVDCGTLPSAAGALLSCSVTLSTAVAIGESTSDGAHVFTITVTAPSTTGSITNYASVAPDGSGTPPSPGAGCVTTSCASSSTTITAPNLTITKSSPATALVGASYSYSFDLGNAGTAVSPLTVNVSEDLPTGVVATAVTAGSGVSSVNCGTLPSAAGALLSCSVTLSTAVAIGESTSDGAHVFTITVTAPSTTGSITNYASVAPDGSGTPPTPGAGCVTTSCASSSTTITAPNVTIAKTAPSGALPSASIAYLFDLGNTGTALSPLTINVTEQLPAGVVATSVAAGAGVNAVNCGTLPSAAGATLNCVVDLTTHIPAGESTSDGAHAFTVNATTPASLGVITNYASVATDGSGTPPTPGAGCLATSCTSATTSVDNYDMTIAKTGPATVNGGASLAYVLDLGNAGTAVSPLTINVSEQLPAGVVLNSITAGPGVSSVNCGTLPSAAGATLSCVVTLLTAVAAGEATNDGAHSFTLNATAPSTPGAITNYASVSPAGAGTPPTPGSGCTPAASCGSVATTVLVPTMMIAKSGPSTALVDSSYTYSFDLGNIGNVDSPLTVNVAEQLPTGVVATAVAPGAGVSSVNCGSLPSVAGAALSCVVTLSSAVAVGESTSDGAHVFTLSATAPASMGSITNYVSVSTDGSGTPATPGAGCVSASCSSAATSVVAPNITIAKSAPSSVMAGASLAYAIDLGNSGTALSPMTVNVTEQLPAGVVLNSIAAGVGVSSVNCGTLPSAPGAALSCTVTLATAIPTTGTSSDGVHVFTLNTTAPVAAGSITNYVSASPLGSGAPATPGAGCVTTSCASATTSVVSVVMTIAKSGPAMVRPNSSLAYVIDLGNSGATASPLTVNVAEQLPAGVVLNSIASGLGVSSVNCGTLPSAPGATLNCVVTLATPVASGESTSDGAHAFTLNTTSPATTGSITNHASVAVDGSGTPPTPGVGCTPVAACSSATTTVATPDLTISKSGSATALTSSTVTYTFDLGNTGSEVSPLAVNVAEQLPAGVVLTSVGPGAGVAAVNCGPLPSTAGSALSCVISLVSAIPTTGTAADGNHVFTLTMRMPSTVGALTNYASVSPIGDGTPPTPGAGCVAAACASTNTSVVAPNVTVAKTGPATATVGTSFSYAIDLGNTGTAASPLSVSFAERLPAGMVLDSVSPGPGIGALSCDALPSAPGALVNCTITLSSAIPPSGTTSDGDHTFTLDVTAQSSGAAVNYVSVSSAGSGAAPTPGPACAPSCSSASTTVNGPTVTIAKTGPATALTDSALSYTLDLGNTGTAASPMTVNVADQLPAGVVLTGVSAGSGVASASCGSLPSAPGVLVNCVLTLSTVVPVGATASDGNHVITLTTTAPPTTGAIINYASASSTGLGVPPAPGAGCVGSCSSASTAVQSPSLVIAKNGPATVEPGGSISYVLDIGNSGTAASPTTINVAEQLPDGMTLNSVSAGAGVAAVDCGALPSVAGALLNCTLTLTSAVPVGATVADGGHTITLFATAPTLPASFTNYVSVSSTGLSSPPLPGPGCSPSCAASSTSIVATPSASIAGHVWQDTNGNGVCDAAPKPNPALYGAVCDVSEPPYNGLELTLTRVEAGARFGARALPLATATLDANGNYEFNGLAAGTYQVRITPPAGHVATFDIDGGRDHIATVTIAAAERRADVDFGYAAPGSVSGRVFIDDNGNGVQDEGEVGIPGVTIFVIDSNGNVVATLTTDENGDFRTDTLPPGTYSLSDTPVSGTARGAITPGSGGGSVSDNSIVGVSVAPGTQVLGNSFARVPVATSPAAGPRGPLAFTGRNVRTTLGGAALLMAFGLLLLAGTRRKRDD